MKASTYSGLFLAAVFLAFGGCQADNGAPLALSPVVRVRRMVFNDRTGVLSWIDGSDPTGQRRLQLNFGGRVSRGDLALLDREMNRCAAVLNLDKICTLLNALNYFLFIVQQNNGGRLNHRDRAHRELRNMIFRFTQLKNQAKARRVESRENVALANGLHRPGTIQTRARVGGSRGLVIAKWAWDFMPKHGECSKRVLKCGSMMNAGSRVSPTAMGECDVAFKKCLDDGLHRLGRSATAAKRKERLACYTVAFDIARASLGPGLLGGARLF